MSQQQQQQQRQHHSPQQRQIQGSNFQFRLTSQRNDSPQRYSFASGAKTKSNGMAMMGSLSKKDGLPDRQVSKHDPVSRAERQEQMASFKKLRDVAQRLLQQNAKSQKMVLERNATVDVARQRLENWKQSQDKLTEYKTRMETVCASAKQRNEDMRHALDRVQTVASDVHEHTREVERSLNRSDGFLNLVNGMLNTFSEKAKWIEEKKGNLIQNEEERQRELEIVKKSFEEQEIKAQELIHLLDEENRKMAIIEERHEALNRDIDERKSMVEWKTSLNSATNEKATELQREQRVTRDSTDHILAEIETYEIQMNELEVKKEFIHGTFKKLEAISTIEDHEGSLREYEKIVNSCQEKGINIESFTGFQMEAMKALETLEKMTQEMDQRKHSLQASNAKCNILDDDILTAQQKIDDHQSTLTQYENELKQIERDGTASIEKMKHLQEHMNFLEMSIADKMKDIHNIKSLISTMPEESDVREQEKRQELETLTRETQQQKEKEKSLDRDVTTLQEQCKSLSHQLNWMKPDIVHLNEELNREELKLRERHRTLETTKQSHDEHETRCALQISQLEEQIKNMTEIKQEEEMELQQEIVDYKSKFSSEKLKHDEIYDKHYQKLLQTRRDEMERQLKKRVAKSAERHAEITNLMSKHEENRQHAERQHQENLIKIEDRMETQKRAVEEIKKKQASLSREHKRKPDPATDNKQDIKVKRRKVTEVGTFKKTPKVLAPMDIVSSQDMESEWETSQIMPKRNIQPRRRRVARRRASSTDTISKSPSHSTVKRVSFTSDTNSRSPSEDMDFFDEDIFD